MEVIGGARVLGLIQLGRVVGVYESRDEALASVEVCFTA
jgi:hypothetical protein